MYLTAPPNTAIRVEFHAGGREKVLQQWQDSLKRRLWETKVKEAPVFSAANAGVGGIIRRVEQQAVEVLLMMLFFACVPLLPFACTGLQVGERGVF